MTGIVSPTLYVGGVLEPVSLLPEATFNVMCSDGVEKLPCAVKRRHEYLSYSSVLFLPNFFEDIFFSADVWTFCNLSNRGSGLFPHYRAIAIACEENN
jgi:hypothetical protein